MNAKDFTTIIQHKIKSQCGSNPTPAQAFAAQKIYEAFLHPKKRWIWICGNIGSGKTTLVNAVTSIFPHWKFVKAIEIRDMTTLTGLCIPEILIIDDAGKNPEQINNMGDYVDVLPYILHMRDNKGITIFTSQHKFQSLLPVDFSLQDRFKSIGAEVIINDKSLRT